MDHSPRCLLQRALICLILCCAAAQTSAWELSSYASVNNDGSLHIRGNRVHLYGIHIPETARSCNNRVRPTVCGSRAALALDFKINGFVLCDILERNQDGSLVGWCRVNFSHFDDGDDLAAYLLQHGWAVALPHASVKYQTLEKIARSRGFGVWGNPADRIIFPD